jgi:SAM-dependent methyltransferase
MAESFGSDPQRYDRSRPRYPNAMVEAIVAAGPGPEVLDVGCGTGIAARQFQAAGCRVLGVDVDARMAEFARRQGIDVEVAAFEAWDPAGREFDAVVSGQTWHWIDPVAGAAKAAGVLRPGGRLAVFWNVFEPAPEVAEAFAAVYRRIVPDSLSARPWMGRSIGYSALCARAADGIQEAGGFRDTGQWRFEWERSYTRDEWLDQLPTSGDASQFPPDKLEEVMAGVGDAIDGIGGSFTMGYSAVVVTAARTESP